MMLMVIYFIFSASIRCGTASSAQSPIEFPKPNRLFNRFWPSNTDLEADADNQFGANVEAFNEIMEPKQRRSSDINEQFLPSYYDADLPYGVEAAPSRMTRMIRNKARPHRMSFQSLCPSRRETIFLNLDIEYEYRPNHYEEVVCVGQTPIENDPNHRPVCSEAGFSCIQLNRTLFLTRRIRDTGCWESETRIVPAGCECMWPKHNLGDIAAHH